jgi:hypothetical protein
VTNNNNSKGVVSVKHGHITRRGNKVNEDYAFSNESCIFVIDGATGLTKHKVTNEQSDARWFAQRLGLRLSLCLSDLRRSISEIVSGITRELLYEFKEFPTGKKCDELYMPSASISVFRINGDSLEFFQLGDCTSAIAYKPGLVIPLLDPTLPNLDYLVIQDLLKLSQKHKVSNIYVVPYVMERVLAHRALKNKPDGYWVLDLTGKGIPHAETRVTKLEEVKSFAVMSDGFSQTVDLVSMFDMATLMQTLDKERIKDIIVQLFAIREDDPLFDKYPRLKLHDDTSIAWYTL